MSYGITLKYHIFCIAHSVLTRNIDSVDTKQKLPNKNDQYYIIITSYFITNDSIFHYNGQHYIIMSLMFHYN